MFEEGSAAVESGLGLTLWELGLALTEEPRRGGGGLLEVSFLWAFFSLDVNEVEAVCEGWAARRENSLRLPAPATEGTGTFNEA